MKPVTTRTWSTPLIIGCSAVVSISGIMMFFHLQSNLVKSMHEWLGLLFVAAIVLHLLNHWLSFSRYFSNRSALGVISTVVALAAILIFAGAGEQHRAPPFRQLTTMVEQAPLSAVAALQQQSGDELVDRLRAAGVHVESAAQSLEQVAAGNDRRAADLISIVLVGKGNR